MSTALNQLPIHPSLSHYSNYEEIHSVGLYVCGAFDKSLGENKFLVETRKTVMVTYLDNVRRRHYLGDPTIVKVQIGRFSTKWFANQETITSLGYAYSSRNRQWMLRNDPAFYGTERILPYHSQLRADHSATSKWKIGLEVEKVCPSLQLDELAYKIFEETGWAKERDGSLGDGGFEMVSPILPMTDKKRLKKSLALVKKYMECDSNNKCGGHINVSSEDQSSEQILETLKSSLGFLYAIYKNRMNNHYCAARTYSNYISTPTKYSAFFLKNPKILEIRLFPAVKTTKSLLWRVDLLKILLTTIKGNFITKVASMNKKKSWLVWHLSKIYSAADIKRITKDAIYLQDKWVKKFTSKELQKLIDLGYGEAVRSISIDRPVGSLNFSGSQQQSESTTITVSDEVFEAITLPEIDSYFNI